MKTQTTDQRKLLEEYEINLIKQLNYNESNKVRPKYEWIKNMIIDQAYILKVNNKNFVGRQMEDSLNTFFKEKSEQSFTNNIVLDLTNLSLSDLISLHGWIDSEADLIETLGGDNTAKLKEAREQMILVHQEIEKKRNQLFGGE